MQSMIELSQKDAMGLAFILSIILVSAPFLLSRFQARQQWAKIKDGDNFVGMLDKKNRTESLKIDAANRRLAIANMIRQDDARRQTVNIVGLLVVYSLIELGFSIKNNLIYGTNISTEALFSSIIGLLIAPIFYWFFTGLYSEITHALNTVKQEFGVNGRLVMSDIASVEPAKLNKLDVNIFSV